MPKAIVHGAGGTLAPAHQGAPAAHRPPARRPAVLLHHLRLDDVELAGRRAGQRGDAGPVRRLAVPSRRRGAVGHRAARSGSTVFGTSAKYLDALQEGRAAAGTHSHDLSDLARRCSRPARRWLPESVRLGLSGGQARRAARLDLGRHRHRLLLRARQPGGAGRAARSRCAGSASRSRSGTTRAGRWWARRASWSAPSPSPACRWGSGTTRTAAATATPISRASPACGAMATLPSSPSMAA